jgi:hypothetical protein
MEATAATSLQLPEPMSDILTEELNIAQTDLIATVIGKNAEIDQSYGFGLEHFRCT